MWLRFVRVVVWRHRLTHHQFEILFNYNKTYYIVRTHSYFSSSHLYYRDRDPPSLPPPLAHPLCFIPYTWLKTTLVSRFNVIASCGIVRCVKSAAALPYAAILHTHFPAKLLALCALAYRKFVCIGVSTFSTLFPNNNSVLVRIENVYKMRLT